MESRHAKEDIVFVVSPEVMTGQGSPSILLRELIRALWGGKWFVMFVTSVFAGGSTVYALTATEWYRAEVVLVAAQPRNGIDANLGGIASIAGLAGVDLSTGADAAESIAVLRSRELARQFIEDLELLPVLFADQWDDVAGSWISGDPEESPDIRDGVKLFNDQVRYVSQDSRTGLINLGIEWTDAEEAARWAELLVARVNSMTRMRALTEAEANIAFLREQLDMMSVVTMQQTVAGLLEKELQTLMLAQGNKEYAFRVIDPPVPPKIRARPKRKLVVILWTMGGGIFSTLLVLAMHGVRINRQRSIPVDPSAR